MSSQLRRALQARLRRDEGFSMILVIGIGMVLMLVVSLLMAYVIASIAPARREQDYQAAIAAAQAGLDDYLSRLNANNTYWQGVDCTNTAMRRPFPGGAPPCTWGPGTSVGWSPIPGATNPAGQPCSATPTPPNCGLFHYDVNTSRTLSTGTITVTSTGRSGRVDRSLQADVRRKGFADFLYYSDIESVDPSNRYVYGVNNTTAQTRCSRHYWDSPPRDTAYCRDIYFASGDRINGPLHSNDSLLITGNPVFNGPVTTAAPSCAPGRSGVPRPAASCYRNGGSARPTFARGIGYAAQVQLPPTNAALKAQTDPATAQGSPGCLYTGPTRIAFNAGGTMTVWSPYSLSLNPGCGTPSPMNQLVPVPTDNVIFVRNVPSAQAAPRPGNCAPGLLGGYPQAGDVNYSYGEYDCRAGTVFLSGALAGRLTVASDNNIVVVDDLTYAGGAAGTDSLGLVANNSVEIYHPVACSSWTGSTCRSGWNMNRPGGLGPFANPTIEAAMLSLSHSFAVQLYPLGSPLGTLSVFGSIAQRFRGAVGTFSGAGPVSGYLKDYRYDTRLQYAPPPYYLDPVQSAYGPVTIAEVKAAY